MQFESILPTIDYIPVEEQHIRFQISMIFIPQYSEESVALCTQYQAAKLALNVGKGFVAGCKNRCVRTQHKSGFALI